MPPRGLVAKLAATAAQHVEDSDLWARTGVQDCHQPASPACPRDTSGAGGGATAVATPSEALPLVADVLLGDAQGPALDRLLSIVAADVSLWSPTVVASSRDELRRAVAGTDDSLTDVLVTVGPIHAVTERSHAEWRATGTFANPCVVDDDVLVAPTGRRIDCSGELVVVQRYGTVVSIHCYFDTALILEQLLLPRAVGGS